jgi:hypothetical protein
MTRVHVICEGQTEETFIRELLNPYFNSRGIYLYPSLIGTVGHKGGTVNAERLFIDIRNRLNDKTAYCTTFFDFYALPTDFPGKTEATRQHNITDKAKAIQLGLSRKLEEKLDNNSMRRFIPYVQMYEFEGLLFSNPTNFAKGINQANLAVQFQNIRNNFVSPEEINDSPITAPSKRVLRLAPRYEKPLYGSLAALEIGLDAILSECVLFRDWVERLESLRPSTN